MRRRVSVMCLGAVVLVTACRSGVSQNPDAAVVVHFGDSTAITDYLPIEQRVDVLLNARLAEHYAGQRVVSHNVAKSGDTIRDLLGARRYLGGWITRPSRYRTDVLDRLDRIDVALVRYGQNDMKRMPPDAFRREVERLCDRLLHDYPGVHLVLETNTYMDPAHGGHERDNVNNDVYWQVNRDVARDRGYPLVDNFARRKREVAAGNWDLYIRSRKLSQQGFKQLIVDGSKDAEMAGVPGWYGNRHPNPNAVRVAADEEYRVLTATWPDRLPRGGRRVSADAMSRD